MSKLVKQFCSIYLILHFQCPSGGVKLECLKGPVSYQELMSTISSICPEVCSHQVEVHSTGQLPDVQYMIPTDRAENLPKSGKFLNIRLRGFQLG